MNMTFNEFVNSLDYNQLLTIDKFIDSLDYNQLLYALKCLQKRIQEKENEERIKLFCVADDLSVIGYFSKKSKAYDCLIDCIKKQKKDKTKINYDNEEYSIKIKFILKSEYDVYNVDVIE